MVSAANGAEKFYSLEDHSCRSEGIDQAKDLDQKAAHAWVGHPYFDMIDNSTDFEMKLNRMIQSVCVKLGIDVRDRLQTNSRKVKFLIKGPLPADDKFPVDFRDFTVVHNYLRTIGKDTQSRLRKRGHKNHWSYTHTIRRPVHGQSVEVKTTLSTRDYALMLTQKDMNHVTVYKTRRCFLLNDQYFQMDLYKEPWHPRCKGLILLETYTTLSSDELYQRLPNFLTIVMEVTGNPKYSMFNLSLKEAWENNKHFNNGAYPTLECDTRYDKNQSGKQNKSDDDERDETFLACCDEKSMKHHIANGCCGVNGSMNHQNGVVNGVNGTGKFKGYENGHNGVSCDNGHNTKNGKPNGSNTNNSQRVM